jgi:ribulose-5-phosphate 4-epimerase/fuculose-1-phosphate aldolase
MTSTVTAEDFVRTCHFLAAAGRGMSTGGNAGGRIGGRVLLTPTGVRLAGVEEQALSVIDLDGSRLSGVKLPKVGSVHAVRNRCG